MTDVVRYQGASGDMNPMHHDDELARSAGFPAAFSVGMLGAGWLAACVTEVFGEESVRRFGTRFSAIVHRGDRLMASGEVTEVRESGEGPLAVVALRLVNQHGETVMTGEAHVLSASPVVDSTQ